MGIFSPLVDIHYFREFRSKFHRIFFPCIIPSRQKESKVHILKENKEIKQATVLVQKVIMKLREFVRLIFLSCILCDK